MPESDQISIISKGSGQNASGDTPRSPPNPQPHLAPPGYPHPPPLPTAMGPMQPQYMPPHYTAQYMQPPVGYYAAPMYQGINGQVLPPPHMGGIPPPQYGPPYAQRPPPRQQQQQQVVVIGGHPQVAQPVVPVAPSFGTHYTLACCVFWFGGFLFGAIAFILAAVGSGKARSDPKTARQYASASIAVSVSGIIVVLVGGVIALAVLASMGVFSNDNVSSSSNYYTKYCYNSYGQRVACSSISLYG